MATEDMQKIIAFTNIGLMVAMALAGLLVARDAVRLAGTGSPEPLGQDASRPASKRVLPLNDYKPVLSNNVFGFDAGSLSPLSSRSGAASPAVPMADVALSVLGTVAWSGGFGYAIIKDPAGKQVVVKTGEQIPGSGTLELVFPNKIVVSLNGAKHEVDVLDVQSPASSSRPAPKARKGADGFVKKTGEGAYVVDRTAVQESINNPKRLMTDARTVPYINPEGKQEGLTVTEVLKGGIYDQLGIRNGDVIISVNGLKLSTPESALQAYTSIKGARRLSVDIIRGGAKKTLSYTLR